VIDAFLLSMGVIFVAELGDKSQLMALAFATRFKAWVVLVAITVALLIEFAISVLVGRIFALALPTNVISLIAGVAFLAFAAWTLRGEDDDDRPVDRAVSSTFAAMVTVGTTFFLAELGDKTMLAVVTLASTQDPIGTWLGATTGEVAADALAIGVGAALGARLPARAIKLFAAATFVVFGVILIAEALGLF
jgi:putative Ca2+/H+ antiporter (TMEM165/GDT1 family)